MLSVFLRIYTTNVNNSDIRYKAEVRCYKFIFVSTLLHLNLVEHNASELFSVWDVLLKEYLLRQPSTLEEPFSYMKLKIKNSSNHKHIINLIFMYI